jgi:hypothetical protein
VLIPELYGGRNSGRGTESYVHVKLGLPLGGFGGAEHPRLPLSIQPVHPSGASERHSAPQDGQVSCRRNLSRG